MENGLWHFATDSAVKNNIAAAEGARIIINPLPLSNKAAMILAQAPALEQKACGSSILLLQSILN
jgi:hypothetical protein